MFSAALPLRAAYIERVAAKSQWTRLIAQTVEEPKPAYVTAHLAAPKVTLIPTLHVASIAFYDRVLRYLEEAVKRQNNVRVLLEGICDTKEDEQQQLQEFRDIMSSEQLRLTIKAKAVENSLYSRETMRDMCAELAVNFEQLEKIQDSVRLEACYLKPQMASTCGLNLVNNADLDMKEVQNLLVEQLMEDQTPIKDGSVLPSGIPISQIGTFPKVRQAREKKVADAARQYCQSWIADEKEGEIIIPWGCFHIDSIYHHLTTAPLHTVPEIRMVKDDGWQESVPFDIPPELLEK